MTPPHSSPVTEPDLLEMADHLDGLAILLTKENTDSEAGFDQLCADAAKVIRRHAQQPASPVNADTKWIADLIRNEYDKAPDHYRMGDNWDDGAERIAAQIVEQLSIPAQCAPDAIAMAREALKPFALNIGAVSLSKALGHISREHLWAARDALAALTSTNSAPSETYTEICMNEKCPRGQGVPIEVVRPLTRPDGVPTYCTPDGPKFCEERSIDSRCPDCAVTSHDRSQGE